MSVSSYLMIVLNTPSWGAAPITHGALFFKPHFPLTLTFPRDWGQTGWPFSFPARLWGGGGGASLLKPKAESRESTLCFLSLSYRVLNSPYQVPKSLWMADFYKIKASHLSQMTMRDLGEFSLSPVTDDSCRRWWAGGATPNVLWMDAQQPGLKNNPICLDAKKSKHPPHPQPCTPTHPSSLFKSKFLLGIADAFCPPDEKCIKVNGHDSRGRLTVINTRKMSQDIEEVMD